MAEWHETMRFERIEGSVRFVDIYAERWANKADEIEAKKSWTAHAPMNGPSSYTKTINDEAGTSFEFIPRQKKQKFPVMRKVWTEKVT